MFRPLLACLLLGVAASAAAEPVTVLQSTGSSINRLDLVVMGDGYTAAELASGKYASDVAAAMNGFFSEPPYNEYIPYFNVYRVEVASAESGADHPSRGVLRNTALDAAYDCAGITRLICVNTSKVNAILASSLPAPTARDLILVLVNDPEYGGSGGAVAVSSTHPAAVQLVLHEVGHTLGQLADEYDGPNPPVCNNTVEPSAVNVTMATLRENVKWNAWIDPATPVPTGGTTNGVPGLFQGAQYCVAGLFRPTYNSKMRSLGLPFHQINSEQHVKRFYNFVSPIDSATPTQSSVLVPAGLTRVFAVTTPLPVSHSLNVVWKLDGAEVATGTQYAVTSATPPGRHTLEVVVSDSTPFVKPGAAALRASRTWTVIVQAGHGDFDGDGKTDIGVFRPSTGNWYVRFAATGTGLTFLWGGAGDIPTVGDYDGDGRSDIAIFRPSNGTWYIRYTASGALLSFLWGGAGDVPTQGDYDGDGKTDMAIFRPSTGTWYVRYTATGAGITLVWGGAGDVPTQSDYDGDGRTDIAIFRPSTGTWYVRYTATGTGITLVWGGTGDVAVPGDYDGDGKTDMAIFRPSTGTWYVRYTATGAGITLVWGGAGDVSAPGDYDGDGLTDIAIFRPSTGTWYIRYSASGTGTSFVWGGTGDIPVLGRS